MGNNNNGRLTRLQLLQLEGIADEAWLGLKAEVEEIKRGGHNGKDNPQGTERSKAITRNVS